MVRHISDMINIQYIRQKEPRGLGHAILCAKSFIGDEPFAVILGDDIVDSKTPCLKQLLDIYYEYNTTIIGVQKIDRNDVNKYGIIQGKYIDENIHLIKDLVEKPDIESAPSNIAILGRYILKPDIFKILENQKPGKNNEIQLTDALKTLCETQAMYAYEFTLRQKERLCY